MKSSACECPTCTEAAARPGMAQVTHVESAAYTEGVWTMTNGEFYAELYKAFVAGFAESGEGWNGEYPFRDKGIDIAADPDVQAAFGEWKGVA